MEVIPELPNEIGIECLLRVPRTCHSVMRAVCTSWNELLSSPEFHRQRKEEGRARRFACLVQSLRETVHIPGRKIAGSPAYGLTLFDVDRRSWERLEPIPWYPDGLPLFCQVIGVDGRVVVMGGWDPVTWEPTRGVFVYDYVAREWREGKKMPAARSFFAAATDEGLVYVAGGHDENKNALRSVDVYDVRRNEWAALGEMGEERDECEGVVVGREFWVVSGYGSDEQGRFVESVEVLDLEKRVWRRVEWAWKGGRGARGCVWVGEGGELGCLEGVEGVRVGMCVVGVGERKGVVIGCGYQGGPLGCFVVELGEGRGKWEKVELPVEFRGFVQLGCLLEM